MLPSFAIIVPMLIFIAHLVHRQGELQHSRIEQDLLKESRMVTATIERDLHGVMAMLETLALMPALHQEDFAAFHQQASQITERYGIVIVLTDPSGQQRLNTSVPWNTPLPSFLDPNVARSIQETRTPHVSDVLAGAVSGRELIGIVSPVLHSGEVTYFLTAILPLQRIQDILAQAGVGEERTVGVADRKGRIVSVVPDRSGEKDQSGFLDRIIWTADREGVSVGRGLFGAPEVSGYSTSEITGWTAVVSLSRREIDARVTRELSRVVLIGATLLILSGLLAYGFGLRIVRAARLLTVAGKALQSGRCVPPVRTGWREANEVGLALTTAFSRLSEKSVALRVAEEQYRALARSAPVGIIQTDLEGRCTSVNERWCAIAGARPEQAQGNGWADFLHPEDREEVFSQWRHSVAENRPFRLEYRFRTRSGETIWVLGEALPLRNDEGSTTGYVGAVTDITGYKLHEQQRREAEEQLTRAMAVSRMFAFEWDIATDVVRRSEACGAILGLSESPMSDTGQSFFDHVLAEDRQGFVRTVTGLNRNCPNYAVSYRYQRPDGSVAWLEEAAAAVFRQDGGMIRLIGITADVTATRQAEAAVRESEARLRFALDSAEIGIWQMDAVNGAMTWSDIQYQLFGIDPDTVTATPDGPSRNGFEALVDPEDREILHDRIEEALRSGQSFKLDFRINHPPDGHVRWLALRCGVQRDSKGVPERLIGVSWDITGRKTAEVILRDSNAGLEARVAERTHALTDASRELSVEIRRREEAQATLMQSQNLQALGLVVDGMSHEFNNILATIQSSYNLLRRRITVADQIAALDLAEPAVTRATKLIQHLQALARHGPAQPSLVDLATALADSADMIRHTVGCRGRCRFDVEVGLWPAILDPIRLTALLVTLAVNMRDTMPDGGELEVAACNRASDGDPGSGEWIVISVKDTASIDSASNTGAPENVLTPKAHQSGIGLSLTAAHNFTTQAGGRLLVRSAPEAGTSIEIHLPRAVMTGPVNEPQKNPELAALSGGATILLVDDDENFRLLTAHLLRDLGYSVIEAPNTEVAITLAHIAEQVDLVVSDIQMPGEGGRTLWRRLRLDRPALPILFISGSANAAIADGEQVLRKPFSGTQLAEAVLERLGRLANASVPAQTSIPVFDKLRDNLRNPRLRKVYDYWRSWRDPTGNLPDCDFFRIGGTDMADNSFIVEVIDGCHTVGFRFVQIGRILEQRLGRSLVGEMMGDDGDELGSAGASYRRCLETASPSYEYVHYSLADETPLLFERLLLPLSDDGPA